MPVDPRTAMDVARAAAEAAGAAALRHFRAGVRVETKLDRTPVTVADREAEAAAEEVVHRAFPTHGFLGEEGGARGGTSGPRWIVDPVDGTRGFTRGGTFWGPLVALEEEGRIVAGAMGLPALREVYYAARGLGAWLEAGGAGPLRLRVSGVADWAEATLSLGEVHALLAPPLRDPVVRIATACASTRCYGDLAGAAMVLAGRAEAWIEAGVRAWDLAALAVLVEEAGGRFTDFEGRPSIASGRCVASNGLVHEQLLAALAR